MNYEKQNLTNGSDETAGTESNKEIEVKMLVAIKFATKRLNITYFVRIIDIENDDINIDYLGAKGKMKVYLFQEDLWQKTI